MPCYGLAGSVPTGYCCVAADNTQVPFTLDDLKGLYAPMLQQGSAAFQSRQAKKADARAATTTVAVQAITWA